MPLLHKQKFTKKAIPKDLDPDQEVFYSKLTQEIFLDYEEFFERTILCNSLVWTCCLTGKTGLTYAEAVESEQKARKSMSTFPYVLEKVIVYLINLTKRGNIKDLIDDVFGYAKDRYFIGEILQVAGQKHQTCKIIDVLIPQSALSEQHQHQQQQQASSSFEESIDVELDQPNTKKPQSAATNGLLVDAAKIKYLVETESKLNGQSTRQTLKANQLVRFKNQLTKDKIYIIIKTNCDVLHSVWTISEKAHFKFNLTSTKFSELFKGDPPCFQTTYGRGQFSRTSLNNSKLNKSLSNTSISKQKQSLNNSRSSSKQQSAASPQKKSSKSKKPEGRLAQILNKKISDMTSDEFEMWRENKREDDLRELELIEYEADKLSKKDEKEKEKERLKAEKNKQKEYLKELKKPKEDLECDNLTELPQPTPIQSKITQSMFGDSLMLLEFLAYFGDLFDLKADFPTGFNFELLENALFSKSCDSALCNLLLFYLDSVFKCYDEETFDTDAANVDTDDADNEDMDLSDDEEISLEQLYKEPASRASDRESFSSLAESYSKLIKSIQGRQYKSIGLDVYTISEMLRLYFLTSGSTHHSKTKFWYQQRGGYTRMDEIGIDFSLNEKSILKKLETMNVYELDPEDKLKILTSLCHQLMSQVRLRDLIEDNWSKLTQLRAQLRDLQTEENRRLREEQSERWKKKLQEKAKEKARLEEIKTNVQKSSSNTNRKDEDDLETAKQLQYSNKKREEFLKKEKHILDEINQLQAKCCMSSIGKDRYYRRYWVVKSLPGVYVEDTNDYDELSFFILNDPEIKNEPLIDETASHKENTPNGCAVQTRVNGVKKTSPRCETKWSFYHTPSQIETLIQSLNERGIRESELKQNLIEIKEKIYDILNKTTLVKNLTMSKEEIEKGIQESLKENMNNVLVNIINNNSLSNPQKTKRQVLKMANSALSTAPNFATVLSCEYLESELRTKLLDIEELIFVGSLGSLKVVDRSKWKQELEKLGSYDPQCATLTWSGGEFSKPASEYTIDVLKLEDKELAHLKTVNNLAKALLQIEQSVEKRFLRTPIGECQKTPEKQRRKPAKQTNGLDTAANNHNENSNDSITSSAQQSKYQILHNWEKSLMNCTTLSQIFIHLQSLDESIAWSKSALNAKCRLCKKKCDAEKMLLCDKCDRGHHLYCLRPPLKEIPSGDWFCPECKPKDAEKTPRKMRKSFAREDIYSDENEENGEADENESEDEDNDEDEEDDEEEEEEEDETNNEHSDDSHVNGKLRKGVRAAGRKRTKEETESEESEEEENGENEETEENEEAEEEDNEMSVEENEAEEEEEEKEEDDDTADDEDYVEPNRNKSKIKINGFKKSNKKSHHQVVSEEDEEVNIDEDTADETTESRRGRKRKTTVPSPKETKSSRLVSKTTKLTSRNSRTRVNYNELSEDVSGTDEDARASTKRVKIQSNKCPLSNNDTSSRNTELAHRLKVIEKLLNDMMKHSDGWPFLKPVSKRDAPDYYEVIERPMDFATIKNNINNFKYDDYTNIIDDIRLTFENCWEYNEPGSEIYKTGKRLSAYFESHAKQAGLLDYKS